MTYSDQQVISYIEANFIPFEWSMGERDTWRHFRANHVIWTPSVGVADHHGSIHYQSTGYSPPNDFISALRIGRARCLLAWTRAPEAIRELEAAAGAKNSMTPEALFWLAAAYFFERRDTTRMYQVWEQLATQYPDSPWANHTYPRPAE